MTEPTPELTPDASAENPDAPAASPQAVTAAPPSASASAEAPRVTPPRAPDLESLRPSAEGRPAPPVRWQRLASVVRRHWVVYASTFLANALPAFMEPILFLTAIGLGLGSYVADGMNGIPMGAFMGPGALAMTAMFTAAFETTYGTFVRLVYQKTYDGMLATPLTPTDVFLGEVLWCGCKGFLFTSIVCFVFLTFGYFQGWWPHIQWATIAFVPCVGFVCSLLFAGLGLHVAAITKNMNNFNFFISGALTPMSLFSGMVFPVSDLPPVLRELAYALPLFHVTELNRLCLYGPSQCVSFVWASPIYLIVVTGFLVWNGVRLMRNRIVQ